MEFVSGVQDVRNKIIIAIGGSDMFLEQDHFGISMDSRESDILSAIDPAVREQTGESLRDTDGEWLFKVRKASDRQNIYVIPHSTAGDGTLDKCSDEVYDDGVVVSIMGNATKEEVESLVVGIRPYLADGVKMDWHYFGGRAVIKALRS